MKSITPGPVAAFCLVLHSVCSRISSRSPIASTGSRALLRVGEDHNEGKVAPRNTFDFSPRVQRICYDSGAKEFKGFHPYEITYLIKVFNDVDSYVKRQSKLTIFFLRNSQERNSIEINEHERYPRCRNVIEHQKYSDVG